MNRKTSMKSVRSVRIATTVVLAFVAAWITLRFLVSALHHQVGFDGAMNLQVAASLARGEGYRRSYDDRELFPAEVQTNYPYVLPAAVLFKLFGVGFVTAQIPNLLYFAGTLALVFLLVRRTTVGHPDHMLIWSILTILLCLSVPALHLYGAFGYGEVPALFWFLAACYVLFAPHKQPPGVGRLGCGGILLGLAVATKTVLLIGVGAAGFAVLFSKPSQLRSDWRRALAQASVLLAGFIAPLLPFELYRFASLGGPSGYGAWWGTQLEQIMMQAGVQSGFRDTPSLLEKFQMHFAILARSMQLSPYQLLLLLTCEFGAILAALLAWRRHRAHPVLLAVGLAAVAYLTWWLLITPTQKAWSRRILNGVLLTHVATGVALAALWTGLHPRRMRWVRPLPLPGAAIMLLVAPPLWREIQKPPLLDRPDSGNEIATVAQWFRNRNPHDLVFGEGWYSAPVVSLYAERLVLDLNRWPLARIRDQQPIYLISDIYARSARAFSQILANHASEDLFPEFKQTKVYRVDLESTLNPFDNKPALDLCSFIVFSPETSYPHLFGFNPERQPWRWIRCEADALLQYDGTSTEFSVSFIKPNREQLVFQDSFHLHVFINDREVLSESGFESGPRVLRCSVRSLDLTPGEPVYVRFRCDNVVRAKFDSRQLAVRIQSFGFNHGSESPAGLP